MERGGQDERVRQKRRIEVDEEEEEEGESIIPSSGVILDPMLAIPLIGAADKDEDDDEGSNPDDQQADDDEDEGVDGEDLLDTYEA